MQGDRFDDKIRELLNKAHEDYDNASWDALSDRLDQEDSKTSVDEEYIPVVKQKLDNHRIEVPEEHWTSLKSDLDYIEERRERLYIIKALEAAIVLLLVYTYFNYQWHTSKVDMDLAYIEQVHMENADPQLIEATVSLVQGSDPVTVDRVQLDDIQKRINGVNSLPLLPRNTQVISSSANVDLGIQNMPDALLYSQGYIELIDVIAIKEFETSRPFPTTPEITPLMEKFEKDQPTDGWSFGMPVAFDVNFINTSINLGYLSNQIESGLGGSTLGIAVAYRKGKYEIETGLRYSEKTFVPGLLTNYTKSGVNSFLESQLDHMVIKQIQIPLLGKIYAAPYKNATLYGVAGISLTTIMDNQYAIRRTNQSKARLANAPITDVVDLKNLPRGFAHGGPASENIYLTGVVGFGVQSYMTNGLSWYLQPQYQHSFKSEINQLVSKINTLSLEAGIKFAF